MRSFRSILALSLTAAGIFLAACAGPENGRINAAGLEMESGTLAERFLPEDVPAYSGEPYTAVNENRPFFSEEDFSDSTFESYSELDELGRCGEAFANIGTDLMPTEERGSIGQVKPSGWQTVKYDFVDGKYLYNRCHLIGFQLTGENANERNLITGTRFMNVDGMLPFENMTADYIKETGNHVLYRVTPVFFEDELVARGVLMEAESVEDQGEGIEFCVFVYNVEPGVEINYETGESRLADTSGAETEAAREETADGEVREYVLNTNTKKFHLPDCRSVSDMKETNKEEFTGTREELLLEGYDPCKNCKP